MMGLSDVVRPSFEANRFIKIAGGCARRTMMGYFTMRAWPVARSIFDAM